MTHPPHAAAPSATRSGADRRSSPRAPAPRDLALRLVGNPDVVAIHDLSASGVCCTTVQPLSVMTRVHLVLVLPPSHPGPREVPCDGVVVRCVQDLRRRASGTLDAIDSARGTAFETAIFFTGIEGTDRETLAGYVASLRSSGLVA